MKEPKKNTPVGGLALNLNRNASGDMVGNGCARFRCLYKCDGPRAFSPGLLFKACAELVHFPKNRLVKISYFVFQNFGR